MRTDSLNELQAVYEESGPQGHGHGSARPCVVLASPLLASHFEHLWAWSSLVLAFTCPEAPGLARACHVPQAADM